MKVREMELLAAEGKLNETIESRGVRVLGVKNREYTEVEKDLADFLNTENELMANRLKPKETKFDPYTKDLRLVDAKWDEPHSICCCGHRITYILFCFAIDRRRMSEASRPKLKSLVAKLTQLNKQSDQPCASQTTIVGEQEIQRQEQQLSVTDNDNSVGGEQVQRTATLDHDDALHSDALDADAEPVIISLHRDDESLSSTDSSADDLDDENVAKIDESKLGQTYVDPMIAKLRLAEVISCESNIENILICDSLSLFVHFRMSTICTRWPNKSLAASPINVNKKTAAIRSKIWSYKSLAVMPINRKMETASVRSKNQSVNQLMTMEKMLRMKLKKLNEVSQKHQFDYHSLIRFLYAIERLN